MPRCLDVSQGGRRFALLFGEKLFILAHFGDREEEPTEEHYVSEVLQLCKGITEEPANEILSSRLRTRRIENIVFV